MKGTLNNAPDALSRNLTADPQPEEVLVESEIDQLTATSAAEIRAVTSTGESLRIIDLHNVADNSPEYQKLKSYIRIPPTSTTATPRMRRYWNVRTQLSLEDNLILYGCRLLIPTDERY